MELDEQPYLYARLTQLGECLPYKEKVGGSSPSSSTNESCRCLKRQRKGEEVAIRMFCDLVVRTLVSYAKLTEAAFGLVLKTMGTVMSRMGIDTSVWRQSWRRRLTYILLAILIPPIIG